MDSLRITLLQSDIAIGDKRANLTRLRKTLQSLKGQTDVAVLPETFTSGFEPDPREAAEPTDGLTITTLRQWSQDTCIALVGSYLFCDPNIPQPNPELCRNRAFFLMPSGISYFSDKRHLFRPGGESDHFAPGQRRILIPYMGWRILLLVCYDLRFPVWSRNQGGDEYDLLIYVANWPSARRIAWDTLLRARAIENVCYTCAVNRVGTDRQGVEYNGGSVMLGPRGETLASVPDSKAGHTTITLNLDDLRLFREKFPVGKDADRFHLC